MKYFRIWKKWIKLAFAEQTTYRFNFLLRIIATLLFSFMGPLFALLIYSTTTGITGWNFYEFLLLQGTFILVMGIYNFNIGHLSWITMHEIEQGTFDMNLIRPVKPLLFKILTSIDIDHIAEMSLGLIIVFIAISKINTVISIYQILTYIYLITLAITILLSICIVATSISFLAVKAYGILNLFENIHALGEYPLNIYGATGTFFLTFILPIGLAAFYPASALIGTLSLLFILKLTIVSFLFLGIALTSWHLGIKKYTSAGG